jgi:signal transduction histidine kinase
MRDRAAALGGRLVVTSTTGTGTQVAAEVPSQRPGGPR